MGDYVSTLGKKREVHFDHLLLNDLAYSLKFGVRRQKKMIVL